MNISCNNEPYVIMGQTTLVYNIDAEASFRAQ